ncbi:unnamed protein product [Peniophora sp. CBMAI 1063]|nr:unnamed protein product [Peniophora sp. CBMAI 1063]
MSRELWKSQLEQNYGDVPGLTPAFIEQCLKICQTYDLSGEDVFFKWEASILHKDRIITDDTIGNIEAVVKSDLARAAKQRAQQQARSIASSRGGRPGMNPFIGTPSRSSTRVGPIGSPSTPRTPMPKARGVAFSTPAAAGKHKVRFELSEEDSGKARSYKYMYEKFSQRGLVLDNRIMEFSDLILKHYDLPAFSEPHLTTDEDVYVLGRIVLDAESSASIGVKLNEASLYLEGPRLMEATRVRLRLEPNLRVRGAPKGRSNIGMFPGAIVVMKGRNGGGDYFSVNEILSIPPPSPISAQSDRQIKAEPSSDSFSMIVACGPFTPDSDLEFRPWKTLMERIRTNRPDVVLLLGPFLDSLHSKMKVGDIDEFPEEIFARVFAQDLVDLHSYSPSTLVLLLPSIRDAVHNHTTYPQAALPNHLVESPNVRMIPNPAHFTINGVSFGASSVDSLFHVKKEEYTKSGIEIQPSQVPAESSATDVMSNLCRQLLAQRSFYPVFPTPMDVAHEVNLDVSHLELARITTQTFSGETVAPDVLVVPSRYKQFVKNVDHTMAINPSFATKGMVASVFYGGAGDGPASSRLKIELEKL